MQIAATKSRKPAFLWQLEEFTMFRRVLASLGLLVLVLSACDQQVLVAGPSADPSHYEVVGLVAD